MQLVTCCTFDKNSIGKVHLTHSIGKRIQICTRSLSFQKIPPLIKPDILLTQIHPGAVGDSFQVKFYLILVESPILPVLIILNKLTSYKPHPTQETFTDF